MPPRAPSASSAAEGVGAEVGDGVRLVRVDEVEAVVDDPRPLLGRRLGGADVEAAVDLPRVGRDDLGRDPAREQALRRARWRGRSCRWRSGRR